MKWIGQNIYDLVARFRNDVYLEDISTGTIASGGNLGLDSNNKIVKATITSHDEVTLAGTPDYITISGQEITRNAVDNFTYEYDLNESKRNIRLLNKTYCDKLEIEFRKLMNT